MSDHTRRKFLQQVSLGSTFLIGSDALASANSPSTPTHPKYTTLASFQNPEGDYLLCIRIQCQTPLRQPMAGSLRCEGATIRRFKNYFSPADALRATDTELRWTLSGHTAYPYVLILWLTPPPDTSSESPPRITLDVSQQVSLSLSALVEQSGVEYTSDQLAVSVGLLGSREIGTLDAPAHFNLSSEAKDIRFAVMADPQGGDATDLNNGSITRMKIHNAFVETSVELVKLLDDPAFCLVLGDVVDGQGEETNFNRMLTYLQEANVPWLFSIGNHETKYRITFGADYNFSDFSNYFAAQKSINGLTHLLYSFDLGDWHIIVWPDPLRSNFWETHAHYFDWLERDLEANQDRPTFFLQHVPIHPIGIDPLISYAESVAVKRTLLNLLAQHGNVKYVLSGHVHIPMIASQKTAVSYRGMQLINLPAAGFRPRAFGEEDLTGGPVQGIAVVRFTGQQAQLTFRTVTDQEYSYPASPRAFVPDDYPLWLQHKWELPAEKQLTNSNFSVGLTGWHCRYVYTEEESPSNRCEAQQWEDKPALYLFSASRGYRVPGQDRLPQSINRICQAVVPGASPALSFRYAIDEGTFDPNVWAGAFVWVEGFERDLKKLDHVYAVGKAYRNLRDQHVPAPRPVTQYFDLNPTAGRLHQASLNIARDHEAGQSTRYADLKLDRLVVNLGIWTANEEPSQRAGAYFTDFVLRDTATTSSVDGSPIATLAAEHLWQKTIDHIAGEHINVRKRYVPPRRS